MGYRIDTRFMSELQKYGAKDINACFNCGNCTAVCPHSEGSDTFPRRLIRYGQMGLKEPLIGSRELWVCYYCGECSDTCPREAEPGEFMAAARRYAIASNDLTGLASLMYRYKRAALGVFIFVSLILLALLLKGAGPINGTFFEFIDGHAVHNVGVAVGIISLLAMVSGFILMVRNVNRAAAERGGWNGNARASTRFARGMGAVINEIVSQKRYRECNSDYSKKEPWMVSRWFVHLTILWGFIGLLFATTWDFLDTLPDGAAVALTYPPRLVGTVAAALFLYGCTVALIQRLAKSNKYAANSHFSDWVFSLFMFALALTGVVLLLLAYTAPATVFGNILLLIHAILAFDLVLALPFTKLAHAVYRTAAVFIHAYRGTSEATKLVLEKAGALATIV